MSSAPANRGGARPCRPSAPRAQLLLPAPRLVHPSLVGLVAGDELVDGGGLATVVQLALVQAGGPNAGVVLGLVVPLVAALEVQRRAVVLAEGPALVDVAQLVGGVADLVALRMLGEHLLEEQLGAALVVG